jgi:hypothetical protein
MRAGISSEGGVLVLGRTIISALMDYTARNEAFGVNIVDGTTWSGMAIGRRLLATGRSVVFAATSEAVAPADYNSSTTWSMTVFSKSNSEADVLDAIESGNAYLTPSNFTGTFEAGPEGLPMPSSGTPVYVPTGENVSFAISFTGLSPGNVSIYSATRLLLQESHDGNMSAVLGLPMKRPTSSLLLVGTTGKNDSISVLTDPVTFIQSTMVPGGSLLLDNAEWSLKSSNWTSDEGRLQLVVTGPPATQTLLYLHSPEFQPDAMLGNRIVRSISVGRVMVDPQRSYDPSTQTFILSLNSTGDPIDVTFNSNIPLMTYLTSFIIQPLIMLYLLVISPFAVAITYYEMRGFTRALKRRRRISLLKAHKG